MQIKIIVSFYLIPAWIGKIKKIKIKCWRGCWQIYKEEKSNPMEWKTRKDQILSISCK